VTVVSRVECSGDEGEETYIVFPDPRWQGSALSVGHTGAFRQHEAGDEDQAHDAFLPLRGARRLAESFGGHASGQSAVGMHDDDDILVFLVEEREQGFVADRGGVGGDVGGEGFGRVEGRILGAPGGIAGFVQDVKEGLVGGTSQPGARHEEDGWLGGTGHVVSLSSENSSCEDGSVIDCPGCRKMTRGMRDT